MDKDEILRLKQITGLSALFKDIDFGKAWLPVEEFDDAAAADETDIMKNTADYGVNEDSDN